MVEVVLVLGIVLYNLIERTDTMVVSYCSGGSIGIRYCITYLARKLWHNDGGSCYGAGCIGIRYCITYLGRKLWHNDRGS